MERGVVSMLGVLLCCSFCIAKLPADIELCKAEDLPCIARVTTSIIQNNPKGRNDLAIPPIDPFHIKFVALTQGSSGPLNLDLSFKDVNVYGLSAAKIDRAVGFTKNPRTSKFEMYATIPKLSIRGKYTANGRILLLPIAGNGDSDITLEQVKLSVKFKPVISDRDGHQYIDIDKIKLRLDPVKVSIHLTNLFNGDKTLSDNMNVFLNENWRDVWTELSPSIDQAVAEVAKNLMISLFKKFSYDEIYSN